MSLGDEHLPHEEGAAGPELVGERQFAAGARLCVRPIGGTRRRGGRRSRPVRGAGARAGRVPARAPAHPGRLRELPQADRPAPGGAGGPRRPGLVDKLLPVLDTLDLAEAHLNESLDVSDGRQGAARLAGHAMDILAKEGLERIDQAGVALRPLGARRRGALRGRGRRGRRDHRGRGAALGLPLEGSGAARRHGPRAGVS